MSNKQREQKVFRLQKFKYGGCAFTGIEQTDGCHIFEKSVYPWLKFEAANVIPLCRDEHIMMDYSNVITRTLRNPFERMIYIYNRAKYDLCPVIIRGQLKSLISILRDRKKKYGKYN